MLTVSIISHRQGDLAQQVLDDLAREDRRLARVVVTRNVPESWVPRLAHPTAELILIDNPAPRGFGANHNAAFARCDGPFFATLNPDLSFGTSRLTDLLPRFDDPALAALTPEIVDPQGRREDFTRDLMTLPNLVRRRLGLRPHEFAWVAGICLVLRAEAFRGIGGFDERYFMYCEDAELCGRLALAGWRIGVDPSARVVHDTPRRSLRAPRHFAWHVRSLLQYWASDTFRRELRAPSGRARVSYCDLRSVEPE